MSPPWEIKDSRLPGPVLDGESGYAWPTWREALVDAEAGMGRAYERRRQVFQAAYDAGLSLRQISEAVGLTRAGVHKIIGTQGRPNTVLDAPAFQPKEPAA